MIFNDDNKVKLVFLFPIMNWFTIIYNGIRAKNVSNIVLGIICLLVSCVNVYLFVIFWWLGIYYNYFITRFEYYDNMMQKNLLKNSMSNIEDDYMVTPIQYGSTDVLFRNDVYMLEDQGFLESDFVSLSNNRYHSAPIEVFDNVKLLEKYFMALSQYDTFMSDMKRFENMVRDKAKYVPYVCYWPTYKNMNKAQRNWYFYWRTEVRKGNYMDASLSYIYMYIYELLSGIGESTPQACYDKVLDLWNHYKEDNPNLDNYLYDWTFDYCVIHKLKYNIDIDKNLRYYRKHFMIDMLISQQEGKTPIELSFYTIDAICNYAISKNIFYKDYKDVIQEAIPRAVSLADVAYKSRLGKGILDIYSITREKKYEYFAFISALCKDQYTKIEFSFKPYVTNFDFVNTIYEIVRITQNTLMCLYGMGKNLNKINIDVDIAALVESFTVFQYGYLGKGNVFTPSNKKIEYSEEFLNKLERKIPAVKALLSEQNRGVDAKKMQAF